MMGRGLDVERTPVDDDAEDTGVTIRPTSASPDQLPVCAERLAVDRSERRILVHPDDVLVIRSGDGKLVLG